MNTVKVFLELKEVGGEQLRLRSKENNNSRSVSIALLHFSVLPANIPSNSIGTWMKYLKKNAEVKATNTWIIRIGIAQSFFQNHFVLIADKKNLIHLQRSLLLIVHLILGFGNEFHFPFYWSKLKKILIEVRLTIIERPFCGERGQIRVYILVCLDSISFV